MTRIRIEPQPPPGFRSMVRSLDCIGGWWFSNMPRTGHGIIKFSEFAKWLHVYPKSPYQPGDRLPVRERWQPARNGDTGETVAIYHADWESNGKPEGPYGGEWRDADTMPDWAVRRWEVVASVGVEQIDGEWFWCFSTTL